MTVSLTRSAFVSNGAQSVAMSQLLSIINDGNNPAYLIVSGLDRNEYTASGDGSTGTLTGNGATAGFTQVQGDQREVGIVFAWDASTGTYRNSVYGALADLTYNTSPSPNELSDITFFGTNDIANTTQFNNNAMAVTPKLWTDYGTATFATQSVGELATTQATPDQVCATALKFVGDVWNQSGCWVLAATIAAEAGAALPLTSNYLLVPGVSNGEWKVAYNGPVSADANWASTARAGDVVAFVSLFAGHIATVVSGRGASAMLVDNVGSTAVDGTASDLFIGSPHPASDEFGASPATVVVYRLDTPTVDAAMQNETVSYGTRQSLSSMFSASDWAGTAIIQYDVYASSSSDALVVNGVSSTKLNSPASMAAVTSLSGVYLLAGSVSDTDIIKVRAENAAGYWGDWSSMSVGVAGAEKVSAPKLSGQTATQTWITGHSLNFALPAGTFADPTGSVLTYAAMQGDGKPLPSWLALDPSTGTFSGKIPLTAQSLHLTVTATDIYGKSASDGFAVNIKLPSAPVVASQIQTQTTLLNKTFGFTIPAGAFSDPQGEAFTYTLTQANGTALPAWLTFDPKQALLYSLAAPGTPTTANIKVTATDTDGLSASQTFQVVDRAPLPPLLAKPTPTQIEYAGHGFSFAIPDGTFIEPNAVVAGYVLNYKATLADGTALPSWLYFNESNASFRSNGTPPTTPQTLTIKLMAFDGGSTTATNAIVPALTASETFVLKIVPGSPVILYQMPSMGIFPGVTSIFSLAGAFSDPQGGQLAYTATLADGTALPPWLKLDPSTGTFTGKAPANVPALHVVITATNSVGSASETFAIMDTPFATAQIPNQLVYVGHKFSLSVASIFGDTLGEALSYTCTAGPDSQHLLSSLPPWLTFNPATATFTGTPIAGAQLLDVVVTATNTDGGSLSDSFTITNKGVDIPAVQSQTAAQTVYAGHKLSISSDGVFNDPLGEILTYKAILSTGAPLPSWLTLDRTTGTLSGIAPSPAQTLALTLTATNTEGTSSTEVVTILDKGLDTPTLNVRTADQVVHGGRSLSVSTAGAFSDPLAQTIGYKAALSNGAGLPSWLTLNPVTGTLTGTAPVGSQTLNVVVVATNTDGGKASESITIVDQGLDIPALAVQTADQLLYAGHVFNLVLAANTVVDPANEALTYQATQSNGQALPSWLSFNPSTETFNGTAPKAASTTRVKLTATNTDGQSATETFTVTDKVNTLVLSKPTTSQTWNTAQKLSFALPASTFVDAAGESLTYSAVQVNGTALPGWLALDPANGSLSGTVPITPQTLNLKITATDTDGLTCSDPFAAFIKAAAPVVGTATANQVLIDGQKISIPLASAFSDPQGATLTFTASEIAGPNATSWLHLGNGVLTGTVPVSGSDALGIRVTATNTYGMVAIETFGLAYAPSGSTAPSAFFTNASPATELITLRG